MSTNCQWLVILNNLSIIRVYLAQDLPTWGPATTLSQAVDEPEQAEHGYSGRLGEGDVDPTHQEQADGEEPTGADPVREHTADELTEGVGHGLAAGYQTCQEGQKLLCSVPTPTIVVLGYAA